MTLINGLLIIPDFITLEEEIEFATSIDEQEWYGNGKPLHNINHQLKRRFQMYGHLFCFKDRIVKKRLDGMPSSIHHMMQKIKQFEPQMTNNMDSIMINEYLDNQGIMPHIDASVFGNNILIVSLLSDVVLQLSKLGNIHYTTLPRRSLFILSGESRYLYKHAILKDKVSIFMDNGPNTWHVVEREPRRIAIILREIV